MKIFFLRSALIFIVLFGVMAAVACGGRMPTEIGARNGALAACPDKPNCVSSSAEDARHQIAAFEIQASATSAWQGLRDLLNADSRVEIVTSDGGYLHVVYTSSIMRYRDDVEFLLRSRMNEIALRSASRVGYGDMGVNRDRVEAIRESLSERGLVRASASD